MFPRVDLFPVGLPGDGERVQNIVLAASSTPRPSVSGRRNWTASSNTDGEGVASDVPVLTDDRAPVEYYLDGVR